MPLGQSPFLLHGCPVPVLTGCPQVPASQVRPLSHTLPAQQGSDDPPQIGDPVLLPPLLVAVAPVELVLPPPVEEPVLPPELVGTAPVELALPPLPAEPLPPLVPGPPAEKTHAPPRHVKPWQHSMVETQVERLVPHPPLPPVPPVAGPGHAVQRRAKANVAIARASFISISLKINPPRR